MFCFVFVSDSVNSRSSGDSAVNNRNYFYFVVALGFCLEERALLFSSKAAFVGISEQIIRLVMCQIKNIKNLTGVVLRAVSQNTFSAVFESYFFVIFQIAHLLKQKSFLRKPTLFHSA